MNGVPRTHIEAFDVKVSCILLYFTLTASCEIYEILLYAYAIDLLKPNNQVFKIHLFRFI